MAENDERFDPVLLGLAQQISRANGAGIDPILDAFLGFLRRKTDFFVGADSEKVEAAMLRAVRKQTANARRDQAKREEAAKRAKIEREVAKARKAEQAKAAAAAGAAATAEAIVADGGTAPWSAAVAAGAAARAASDTYTLGELLDLKKAPLVALCNARGLPSDGKTRELVDRLVGVKK